MCQALSHLASGGWASVKQTGVGGDMTAHDQLHPDKRLRIAESQGWKEAPLEKVKQSSQRLI